MIFRKIATFDCVLGFETMNEPHPGYVGKRDLTKWDPRKELHFGFVPTALQSFALGDGIPQLVDHFVRHWPHPTKKDSEKILNPNGKRAWLPGHPCVWREAGVWTLGDDGKPALLRKDYFSKMPATGLAVSFDQDFYLPFVEKFAASIKAVMKNAFIFLSPVPNEPPPVVSKGSIQDAVFSPHWYDLDSTFKKRFTGLLTYNVPELSKVSRDGYVEAKEILGKILS